MNTTTTEVQEGIMTETTETATDETRITEFALVERKRPKDGWSTAKRFCTSFDQDFLEEFAESANTAAGWAQFKVVEA